ncbi:DUF488 domain-containing protein [Aequorivita sediminis]|uniref:DUF488 domain-containing protein n=1 Tax=Aequorivita sediminis TaxID=3073653 RepID=UPI0028A5F80A|nr:DUF488 domain-containing protein [Aequorivita sp. F6058]
MEIQIKRIYEEASKDDGYRVLVDRIWPRGVSKEEAKLDKWMKEIAPTSDLRKWFNHKEERFDDFSKKYNKELEKHSELVTELLQKSKKNKLTLLFGAKNTKHNQAIVLKQHLEKKVDK